MEMREYIEAIAESCRKLIISKPATKQEEYRKIIVQKKEAFFQMEKYTDKQVFHENLSVEELETALEELMQNHFRQLNGFDAEAEHILLVSKKGVPSYKKKKQKKRNKTGKNYALQTFLSSAYTQICRFPAVFMLFISACTGIDRQKKHSKSQVIPKDPHMRRFPCDPLRTRNL